MNKADKAFVEECVRSGNVLRFYKWSKWEKTRDKVLEMDKHECQLCRRKYHRIRPATTVHHVNHLKDRPDLALAIYYVDPEDHKTHRQLISLCHDCHEEVHGWRKKNYVKPLTEERWD